MYKEFGEASGIYRINLRDEHDDGLDIEKIFDYVQTALTRCTEAFLPPLRAKVLFTCKFSKANVDSEGTKIVVNDDDVKLSTQMCELWVPANVPEAVDIMRDKISMHITEYNRNGSGYILESVMEVDLTVINMGRLMSGGHLNQFPPNAIMKHAKCLRYSPKTHLSSN